MFEYRILSTLSLLLGWLLVFGLYKQDYVRFLNMCPGWDLINRFKGASCVTVVSSTELGGCCYSTERPKLARNRCLIEVLIAFSACIGPFVKVLSQLVLFLFLFLNCLIIRYLHKQYVDCTIIIPTSSSITELVFIFCFCRNCHILSCIMLNGFMKDDMVPITQKFIKIISKQAYHLNMKFCLANHQHNETSLSFRCVD